MPIGEAVLLGRRIERPIEPPAEQHVAHHQQQHLHEAAVVRDALDLGDRELRVLRRDQDRGAQPRLLVEEMLARPVVHRRAKRSRHVLVEERDRAMQIVADRVAQAEPVEHVAADHVDPAAREVPSCRQSGRQLSGEFGG